MVQFWNELDGRERPLVFSKKFEKYLDEVESITKIPISQTQRKLLQLEIEHKHFCKLSTEESKQNRIEFGKVKNQLIAEWEKNTGQKWSTYNSDVANSQGKILRKEGMKWDAHELILNSWGSPHFWYNITPAPHPEHQRDIHGKDSLCNKIFQ